MFKINADKLNVIRIALKRAQIKKIEALSLWEQENGVEVFLNAFEKMSNIRRIMYALECNVIPNEI